jgi:hypothetical protein
MPAGARGSAVTGAGLPTLTEGTPSWAVVAGAVMGGAAPGDG